MQCEFAEISLKLLKKLSFIVVNKRWGLFELLKFKSTTTFYSGVFNYR